MAEGRSRAAWDHTAHVLAQTANLNRDPKKGQPYKVADFHPHMRKRDTVFPKVKLRSVKNLLMGFKPAKPDDEPPPPPPTG